MNIVINKKQKKEIAKLKKLIKDHQEVQDSTFKDIVVEMKLTEIQENILWDYVFNDFDDKRLEFK